MDGLDGTSKWEMKRRKKMEYSNVTRTLLCTNKQTKKLEFITTQETMYCFI